MGSECAGEVDDDDRRGEQPDALNPQLEMVAQLLAEGSSDAAAGLAVGRSAKFVQRARRASPALTARVQELQATRAAQAAAGLGALLEEAVGAVRRNLDAERPGDQLRAAALVFDRFRQFSADTEVQARMVALKAEIDQLRQLIESAGDVRAVAGRERGRAS